MDGSTLHICRRDLFWCVWRLDPAEYAQLAWSSSSGVPGSGSSTGQLHLKSSSQVPLKFRYLIYNSTTLLEIMSPMFPRSSLSAGQTRSLVPSDVLLQMYCLRKYCRPAHLQRRVLTDRTMLCTMRMRYGFALLFGRDVTLLRCALCWTVWTLHSYRCQYWGVGPPYPWILQGMTWECHRLGKGGVVTKLWVLPPKFTSNLPPKFTP